MPHADWKQWDPAEQSSSSPSSENGSDDQFDYGFDDELANPDDGRPAAADTWAATHQAEDLVAAEREQAINAMFMFSDHFKKTFARSVHLCIRDPDGIAFSEIVCPLRVPHDSLLD